ncbi:predicted protein [Lichtheimia corymbifera JMRC:FSU:9682]|uniref:Uncharacterized protein n=1 Tax=Lichtheimia corymbifera JMRC:FSU:9682 TaxID=1263082 RepID=A0A068S377_9FUNG|nr:predicted protein [Lichtheimia corymbifera JMRC:FSU:9682]
MTKKRDRPTPGWKRKHISSDHRGSLLLDLQRLWMNGWKQSSAAMWNPGILLWLLGASSAFNEHVYTAEDDDGLDELNGMDTRAYIFDKRGFTTMDDIATLKSMHATATFTIMDEDAYDDSQEYNDTTTPADSL